MQHLAIFKNAERLLSDAGHLFEVERYRSSIALAILAAEEIGKIGILGLNDEERAASVVETGQSFERQLSSHRCKLSSFFSMCQLHMMAKVERAVLKVQTSTLLSFPQQGGNPVAPHPPVRAGVA
jgi:AbiV family abortive infection protein